MKILLVSIGTRGDIEPFLAQAEILKEEGHHVICQFPEQFREMVTNLGYDFFGFDKRFLEMLETQSGKAIMGGGGSGFGQFKGYLNLIRNSFKIQGLIIEQQRDILKKLNPDKVIFHAKALYHYLEAMADPEKFFLLAPIPCMSHPTKEFTHIGLAKWGPFSEKWNLRTYNIVNYFRYGIMKRYLKKYLDDFPNLTFNTKTINDFELNKLRTLYTISPSLFPKPSNWPDSSKITGFYFRNQSKTYTIDLGLDKWLEKHPKAILLTFGSMTNPKPRKYSELILNLLVKHKIPTIVNLSWGGLEKTEIDSDLLFYVKQIPYDWILPKIYGMIHHGGSGTTHQAAVNACVQLIVPHIIDQYFWNRIIIKRKLGPEGVSIHKIKEGNFEEALLRFWTNDQYKSHAIKLYQQMKSEANPKELVKYITQDYFK
ncbi:glycosyltransferase [Algoriphagus sp. SE2]|uniref:glycosyltransferase n=1 Tax=Algoriphagus sp. SE2 TaxID=3141536 RepID=UPI0031CD626B